MPTLRRTAIHLSLLAFLVSACTTATVSTPAATAAPGSGVVPQNWAPPPVTAARAVQLFDAVCGASLPDFASATSRMAANGITLTSAIGTSTRYSATEEVSFKIVDNPGAGKSCSMVYRASGPTASATRAAEAKYRARNVTVTAFPPNSFGLSRLLMQSVR